MDNQQASITKTAFNCPHCGAYTTQYWFGMFADQLSDKGRIPNIPDKNYNENIIDDNKIPAELKQRILDWVGQMDSGLVFFEKNKNGSYLYSQVHNLYLSKCYNCNKISVWIHDNLLYPPEKEGSQPNNDLPKDIIHDFEEARSILSLSPRGAAALLRLCIQKLCIHLGEKGRYVDDDIGSLVSKGLNPLIQKSLDIVRVIGNEAVHPGVIDLKDDRDTALKLFALINLIADQMISHPKTVDLMYEKLPPEKREAIQARNDKATKKS